MKKIIMMLVMATSWSASAELFNAEQEDTMYNLLASCIIDEARYERVSKTTKALFNLSQFKFNEIEDENLKMLMLGEDATEGQAWQHTTDNKLMMLFAVSRPDACGIGFLRAKPSDNVLERLTADYKLKQIEFQDQGVQSSTLYAVNGDFRKYGIIAIVQTTGSSTFEMMSIGYVSAKSLGN
ncbi:hypothetical protein LMH81_12760 [Vibrio lentus]|uniref:hypothetical protein n=1 Tax=Vibrio lentus TaxID=136468 RepID=UPI00101ADE4C|nr:hypothetical protein [Vibrio lentus]MCC4817399.1 hypothetical protein [Vibrio lentus]